MMQTADAPTQADAASEARLKITEVFTSIQGESDLAGWPTVFVRLTGCPLRCRWCDTPYSFHGGRWWSFDQVLEAAEQSGCRHVCVTGGEPLAQKRTLGLLERLCDAGYTVSLETSGAVPVADVDPRVIKIVDFKAPGSGESERNLWEIVDQLQRHDQIKMVLADRPDFDWALSEVRARRLDRWQVLFSPVWNELSPRELGEWIVAEKAPVRLQVQLHKYLWGEAQGR
jgi:7-carboxy-7-deazaguanine synthase